MIVSTQAEQAASVSYLYYLTRITDTDKSGFLWICGVLTLVYPILAIATRLILHFRDLRGGDLVCFFAAVLAIIEHALLFASLHAGFGNTDTASVVSFSLSNTGKLVQATMIILTLAYGLIKLSMAIAVGSAFASNSRHHQFASCAMIAMASFWTVLALMFLYMDCPMYSDEPNILSCSTKALEWWVVSLLDALSEIYIVLYAMIFIRVMPLPKMTKVIASIHITIGGKGHSVPGTRITTLSSGLRNADQLSTVIRNGPSMSSVIGVFEERNDRDISIKEIGELFGEAIRRSEVLREWELENATEDADDEVEV
ncbi:Hypothetical protein D9617_35g089570 [Elsinoe fawcettii]|nr:Hypothetical protein D9617_35g089570 [Elsinoe fawcettii]